MALRRALSFCSTSCLLNGCKVVAEESGVIGLHEGLVGELVAKAGIALHHLVHHCLHQTCSERFRWFALLPPVLARLGAAEGQCLAPPC